MISEFSCINDQREDKVLTKEIGLKIYTTFPTFFLCVSNKLCFLWSLLRLIIL